jgi:TonB family protein
LDGAVICNNSARFVLCKVVLERFSMERFAQDAFGEGLRVIHNARVAGLFLFLLQAPGLALAQTQPQPPVKADTDTKTPFLDNYTPSEEVKRRALGPLRIIKQSGEQKKPATAAPTAPALKPAPVVTTKPKVEETAAKAEEKRTLAVEAAAPAAAPAPAPVPAAVPIAVIAPPTAPAAVAPPPEPAIVARQVNTELIPVAQDPPEFNRSLMRDIPRGGGVVKVAFDVMPDGTTGGIQVVSSNSRRLNTSAVDAVAKWRFKPIDVTVRVDIELHFESQD